MLQLRPLLADPAGTLPSTPGCSLDPGPHGTSGVGVSGGSARRSIGAAAGVSPPPWPSANRSFSGLFGNWDAEAPPVSATATASRTTLLSAVLTPRPLPTRDRTGACARPRHRRMAGAPGTVGSPRGEQTRTRVARGLSAPPAAERAPAGGAGELARRRGDPGA